MITDETLYLAVLQYQKNGNKFVINQRTKEEIEALKLALYRNCNVKIVEIKKESDKTRFELDK